MSDNLAVYLPVELIPQPDDSTCWAASIAMVASYRDSVSYSVDDVATRAGVDHAGKTWDEMLPIFDTWNMQQIAPADFTPQGWSDLLSNYGPLWIAIPGNLFHIVVLSGATGDGTAGGSSATINNPWPPTVGEVQTQTFTDFAEDWDFGEPYGAAIVRG